MIKILIADDHAVVRQGLKQIFGADPELVVVGEATTGAETLEQARGLAWDVLVLDLSLPERNGFDILLTLRAEKPERPILVLSMHAEDQYALRVLKAGAAGYLTKESVPEELTRAVYKVAGGGRYISPALAEKLAFQVGAPTDQPLHASLSDREFQVMRLIAAGQTVTQIAADLALSVKTVSTYRARLLQKLNLRTNADLIHYAIQNHLIDEPVLSAVGPVCRTSADN
ncbi:MAG: response regulator transcription factor [Anaerolineales bacterium]|nr:response regulator transcription factor [Anaerolineales bacterium]